MQVVSLGQVLIIQVHHSWSPDQVIAEQKRLDDVIDDKIPEKGHSSGSRTRIIIVGGGGYGVNADAS